MVIGEKGRDDIGLGLSGKFLVVNSLNRLALLYENQGKYAQAELLYRRLIESGLRCREVPLYKIQHEYAQLLFKTNHKREAVEMENKAKEEEAMPR